MTAQTNTISLFEVLSCLPVDPASGMAYIGTITHHFPAGMTQANAVYGFCHTGCHTLRLRVTYEPSFQMVCITVVAGENKPDSCTILTRSSFYTTVHTLWCRGLDGLVGELLSRRTHQSAA